MKMRLLVGGAAVAGAGTELGRSEDGGLSKEGKVVMEVLFPVAGVLICGIVILLWLQRRCGQRRSKSRIRQLRQHRADQKLSASSSSSMLPTANMTRDENLLESLAPDLPPRFSYAEMSTATNGFSKKLGAGGYGVVYEGVLPAAAGGGASMRVAVKVFLDTHSTACRKGFCAEVLAIGSKRHRNLVELRGFCVEDDYRMLVYELMVNGSLSKYLFSTGAIPGHEPNIIDGPGDDHDGEGTIPAAPAADHRFMLSWSRRKAIAIDTAAALAFLHEGDEDSRIIHCDVKPANILLDENWEGKVSDFGLAKLMWAGAGGGAAAHHDGDDQKKDVEEAKGWSASFPSSAIASVQKASGGGVRGTLGYLAPEWMQQDQGDESSSNPITVASDVYSFGVVLLELVAGRRCMAHGQPFLPGLAFDLLAAGHDLAAILDPRLSPPPSFLSSSSASSLEDLASSVRATVRIALWCLQEDVSLRPSMAAVVSMLRCHAPVPPPPFCPYFAGSSHFFDDDDGHPDYPRPFSLWSTTTPPLLDSSTSSNPYSSLANSWQVSILSGR